MTEKSFDERLTLRTATGTVVVEIKDIAYFKADGNYSQLVTFHDSCTVLTGLGGTGEDAQYGRICACRPQYAG